jgi:hypothetical protein
LNEVNKPRLLLARTKIDLREDRETELLFCM